MNKAKFDLLVNTPLTKEETAKGLLDLAVDGIPTEHKMDEEQSKCLKNAIWCGIELAYAKMSNGTLLEDDINPVLN